MVDYVFPQNYITQKGYHGKYPVKKCGVSDDLSGDILAPSWPNLVCIMIVSNMLCANKIIKQCHHIQCINLSQG